MGGLMIMVSMSLFVINDSIIRGLQQPENPFGVDVLPLSTIVAIRGTIVAGMLGILVYAFEDRPSLRAAATNKFNLGRGFVEAVITILFLSTLPFLPFAIASTLIASNPIFLVLLGIILFSERVGWRRWLAILLGFFGIVLASLGMDTGEFETSQFRWWAIPACIVAAVLVALRDVFTRLVGETLPPLTVALSSALFVMVLGWAYSLFGWQAPNSGQWWALSISSILVMVAYITSVLAIRLGIFAVVGPLRFVSLVVAFMLGIFLFKEPFSWLGFAGAGLIVGSAIWIVLRQAKLDEQAEQK